MTGWILDTNVLSELRKPRCNANVRGWVETQPNENLFLSRVTVAEVRYGIERAKNPVFRRELNDWLEGVLLPWFEDRIFEVDEDVLIAWRRMVERGRAVNYTFSQPDLFIAATAAVHRLAVATRNVEDFVKAGVGVIDPWRD